ncbi:MAG: MurR/RpiR family transcriptional regulator [Eubacteriales bacterium]|nr:MurR/RpiR family transcriptional regulator [Eubacteriales bacterium]
MMEQMKNVAVTRMENAYRELTNVEKGIADFFLNNQEDMNFSATKMAEKLYVSEASLSRFAKKCGFKGYREFIYDYEKQFKKGDAPDLNAMTEKVLGTYQGFLDMSLRLIDEAQIMRIVKMMTEAEYVYVYGVGSSGIAAQEFKLRFMRLGMRVEAISDMHMMKMNSSLVNENCLVIAFSLSGTTKEVISGLRIAKENGAKTVLVTANKSIRNKGNYHEVLKVASVKNMESGTMITPQFPILVMTDIFYIYFFHTDLHSRYAKHESTLSALIVD